MTANMGYARDEKNRIMTSIKNDHELVIFVCIEIKPNLSLQQYRFMDICMMKMSSYTS